MKIIVLSFQGAFLQAESAQSHLTKHFEYFLVKCVPQQSRALNFKEGVLMIETSNNRNKFNSKISFSPDESVKDETICRLKDVLQ